MAKGCRPLDVFSVFERVERERSQSKKLALLKGLKGACRVEAEKLLELALDPHVKFYVSEQTLRRLPCPAKASNPGLSFEELYALLGELQKPSYTLKERLELVEALLKKAKSPLECKWVLRLIAKNPRLGVGEELLKRVFPAMSIYEAKPERIKVMLGYDVWQVEDKLEGLIKSHPEWSIEPKYDGLRCLCFVKALKDDVDVRCYSRNGRRLVQAEGLLIEDALLLAKKEGEFVLDGELYAKNWQSTISALFTRKNVNPELLKNVRYFVFDVLSPEEALKGSSVPYKERRKRLKKLLASKRLRRIVEVPFKVRAFKSANEFLKTVKEEANAAIKSGLEGVMAKAWDAPYVPKRSLYWIKVKALKTVDVKVVGVDREGAKEGEIKALIVLYKGKKVRVGSGLSKELRRCLYEHPEDVIGMVVEVAYQEETPDGSLRFPRLVRIRFDKSPKKRFKCLDKVAL